MQKRLVVGAFAVALLAVSGVVAQDALKSSIPEGKNIGGPFHPLNLTGDKAGQKNCLV